MKKPKILFFDIETRPIVGYAWQKYDTNLIKVTRDVELLCAAWKWKGSSKVHFAKRTQDSDKKLTEKLASVLEQADVIIAHNGDQFDIRKVKGRCLINHINPPAIRSTVDTKKVSKRNFGFSSNKLDDLGRFLGVGQKVNHMDFSVWEGCMADDKAAWSLMERYNKQDVKLLERVYNRMLPWIENHPHVGTMSDKPSACNKCGHGSLRSNGWVYTKAKKYRDFRCRKCNGHTKSTKAYKYGESL